MRKTKSIGTSWSSLLLLLHLLLTNIQAVNTAATTSSVLTISRVTSTSSTPTTATLTATTAISSGNGAFTLTKIPKQTTTQATIALASMTPPIARNHTSPAFKCPKRCKCSKCVSPQQGFALTCRLKKSTQLGEITGQRKVRICSLLVTKSNISRIKKNTFKNLASLRSLYLNYNNISYIDVRAFNGLSKLVELNLDHNNITKLRQASFRGLKSLESLSIRFNNLKTWSGILLRETPKLKYLNLEGNTEFIASKRLFRNTTLRTLDFVSTSKECLQCRLARVNVSEDRLKPMFPCQYVPVELQYIYNDIYSNFILFKGVCKGNTSCELPLTSLKPLKRAWHDACWEVMLKARYFEYFLAVVTIAANVIVVMVTVLSKNLRKSLTFCLIGHMAFCDLMLGVYSAGIAHGHRLTGDPVAFRQWRYTDCPYWRTLFMIGQFMGVSTCLLITIERYLSIIFCMKPFIRLGRKTAGFLVMVFWLLSGIISATIHFVDYEKINDNYMCILIRDFSVASSIHVSQIVLFVFIVVYMMIIGMYIHIYLYVKRSSKNTGVQRESKLASRIGLVIISNVVFFVVPNTITIIVTAGDFYFDISHEANSTIRRWFPVICLVFNACINPFLFAFRNEKFQDEVKALFRGSVKKAQRSLRGKKRVGATLDSNEVNPDRSRTATYTQCSTITLDDIQVGLEMNSPREVVDNKGCLDGLHLHQLNTAELYTSDTVHGLNTEIPDHS